MFFVFLNKNQQEHIWLILLVQKILLLRYNLLLTQLLSITVPCNTDLRAGDIITCQFPKVSRQDSERFDEETSGKYIIKELCHHFDPDRSFTSMKLVRDSFGDA